MQETVLLNIKFWPRVFKALGVLSLVTLVGCASVKTGKLPLPNTPTVNFAAAHQIPEPSQLLALTEEQRAEFLRYFHSPEQSEFAPKNRVFNYLEKDLSLYRFDGANLTAAEALANKTGNCVTLAVLVAALAKEAGVDVAYRTSYSEPTLGFRDDIALSANHVQSYLLQPKQHPSDKLSDRDALVVDYYKDPLDRMGEMFDSERFFAVVYNNLAADALLAKDPSRAFWLSKKALQYDANYSPSINLIAVIYRQQGDLASAEQWFEYGLQQPKNSVLIVGNYLNLAEQKQDFLLQKRLRALIDSAEDDNPYAWYYLAEQFRQQGEFHQAVKFYQKLVDVAPYLHHVNVELAKLYVQLGKHSQAVNVLKQGEMYAYDASSRERYEKKISMVRQLLSTKPQS